MYKDIKIAYSLRGGGVKAIAYIGVWDALLEQGIKPDMIMASSGASVFSALYLAGYSKDEIFEIWKDFSPLKLFGFKNLFKGKLLSTDKAIRFAEKYAGSNDISELSPPLYVACTNVKTGKAKIFDRGNAARIVFASTVFGPIYDHVEIDGERYADGDLTSGYESKYVRERWADFVIGMNTLEQDFTKLSFVEKRGKYTIMSIAARLRLEEELGMLDYIIPNLANGFSISDFKKIEQMYEVGYNIGVKHAENLISELDKFEK